MWRRRWACSDAKKGISPHCKDNSDPPTCGQSQRHLDVQWAGPGRPALFLPSSASSRHTPIAMSECNCYLPKLTGVGARPFIPRLRHLGGQTRARPIKFEMDSTTATHFEKTGCPRHPRSGPPNAAYKSSAPWAAGPFLRVPSGQSTSWDAGRGSGGYIGPPNISNHRHVSTTVRESRTLESSSERVAEGTAATGGCQRGFVFSGWPQAEGPTAVSESGRGRTGAIAPSWRGQCCSADSDLGRGLPLT